VAIALHSFKLDRDGVIRVEHVFHGATEAEAQKLLEAHAAHCPEYGPAYRAGETIEIPVETDELPEGEEATEEALEEFLDLDVTEDEEDEEEPESKEIEHEDE
jgi:hypothetical protein